MASIIFAFTLWVAFQNVETGKFSHPKEVGEFKTMAECSAAAARLKREYRVPRNYQLTREFPTPWHFRLLGADCATSSQE